MSGLSDYDREHIADILYGHGDWFTAHLLRLIAKADVNNRAKLKAVFWEEVEAFEQWQRRTPVEPCRCVYPEKCFCSPEERSARNLQS